MIIPEVTLLAWLKMSQNLREFEVTEILRINGHEYRAEVIFML